MFCQFFQLFKKFQNVEVGTKTVWYSKKMLVEEVDAREMNIDDSVTFINWGNVKVCDILKDGDKITEIRARLDLENKVYCSFIFAFYPFEQF